MSREDYLHKKVRSLKPDFFVRNYYVYYFLFLVDVLLDEELELLVELEEGVLVEEDLV